METGWALGLKHSNRFPRCWPSAVTQLPALGAFHPLPVAMRSLPVGTADAVRIGIGAVGIAPAAVFPIGEPVNALRMCGVLLILAGIAALNFA